MFEDKRQYEGNQPADTESEGFVPVEEEPVEYLEGLRSRLAARDAEDAKPTVDEYRKSLPGPSPDPEYYDYPRMLKDGMEPKIGGEGVSPFPVEYYAKGHEPFDEWVMDANTGTYQPGNATTRVALGAARDIAQGAFEYLLQGADEDIMTLTEGVIAGSKIAAGVGVKALTDIFADNPDPATYDDIIDDAIADAHRFAYNPPSLPEVAGGDPETAKGIVENIARDISILIGGMVAGNKAMPAQMFAVEVPKMMNWYRKTMAFIKKQAFNERGVIAAEMIYSKVGEGGNLSTLLNDMGFSNELTEWLDSSTPGEEDQMAMKNVIEGILTSKVLQAFAVTSRGVYRYAREGGFSGTPVGANQKGMIGFSPSRKPDINDLMENMKTGDGWNPQIYYHGTGADIDDFVPTVHDETSLIGTAVTHDWDYARTYAENSWNRRDVTGTPNMIPVQIKGKIIDNAEWMDMQEDIDPGMDMSAEELTKALVQRGVSGVRMFDDEVFVLDPKNIHRLDDGIPGERPNKPAPDPIDVDIDEFIKQNNIKINREDGFYELDLDGVTSSGTTLRGAVYDMIDTFDRGAGELSIPKKPKWETQIPDPSGNIFDKLNPMSREDAENLLEYARGMKNVLGEPVHGSLRVREKGDGFIVVSQDMNSVNVLDKSGKKRPLGTDDINRLEGQQIPDSAKYPQYAEKYPDVPEPVLKFDKKKGKEFWGKGTSKETREFMKDRLSVQKDMDKNGYKPFFDPEERFDVDPENYPQRVDTRVESMPKKQETIDKWRKKIHTDDARKRLQDAYDEGLKSGYNDRWYAMGQLEKAFIDELGDVEGRAKFRERFSDSMSATTGGADPTSNLMMAMYGNFQRTHDLPIPGAAYDMPVPIGGRYVTGNMAMYDKVINQGKGLGVDQPKRHNFSSNFEGHARSATVDEQMTDLITPGVKAPPGATYGIYEELIAEMAQKNGVNPREFQDVAWGGKKRKTSKGAYDEKPMIDHVNDAIERTSRLTGLSPEEVLKRGIIRGEIPVYAHPAATIAAMAFAVNAAKGENEKVQ